MTDDSLRSRMESLAREAKEAARALAVTPTAEKNRALLAMAELLERAEGEIKKANEADLAAGRAAGLAEAMLERLALDSERIAAMARGLREVAALPDPVGAVMMERELPSGLKLQKLRVPLGVILVIYESRPNVTADAAGLCLKAGNAVVLRGGKEALRSNRAVGDVLSRALAATGLPEAAVRVGPVPEREAVGELLRLSGFIDLVLPRGGEGLIRRVEEESRIPVVRHYQGVCHVYVDRAADLAKALAITHNAKVQRPGVCTAAAPPLGHREIAEKFRPAMAAELKAAGVARRGDAATRKLGPGAKEASEEDWCAEYLALILAVRVVAGLEEALAHIARYGSAHTETIVTEDAAAAERFLREVDSACVFHNVSTRLADGGEFGMGAEIGISTGKLHARGPMGLEELTTYKYVGRGEQVLRR